MDIFFSFWGKMAEKGIICMEIKNSSILSEFVIYVFVIYVILIFFLFWIIFLFFFLKMTVLRNIFVSRGNKILFLSEFVIFISFE